MDEKEPKAAPLKRKYRHVTTAAGGAYKPRTGNTHPPKKPHMAGDRRKKAYGPW